jgi:hypothetical protein
MIITSTTTVKTIEDTIQLIVGDKCLTCFVQFEMTFENDTPIDINLLFAPAGLDERALDKLTDACWQLGS